MLGNSTTRKTAASVVVVSLACVLALLVSFQQAWGIGNDDNSLVAGTSVSVQDNDVPTLSLSDATIDVGETINLDIQISNNPGILGATLEIEYDSRLKLVSISNGDAFSTLDMTKPKEMISGCKIHWDAIDLADSDIKDGVIATLTFEAPESVAGSSLCAVSVAGVLINGQIDVFDRNLEHVDLQSARCNIAVSNSIHSSLEGANIESIQAMTYTGKAICPDLAVSMDGRLLTSGDDYTISYDNNVDVGTATITIIGKGAYSGSKTVTFKIVKAKNSITVKKASVKKNYKAKTLKKKAALIALPKVSADFGKIAWKTQAKDKKNVLRLSKGKVRVKKGARKGTYVIKLKAVVAKSSNYNAATSKVVTVKVTIK